MAAQSRKAVSYTHLDVYKRQGPKYARPAVATLPVYKEEPPQSFQGAGIWKPAQPADQELPGKWWEIFGDSELDTLEEQVTVSNQDLKAAEARLREARALVGFCLLYTSRCV